MCILLIKERNQLNGWTDLHGSSTAAAAATAAAEAFASAATAPEK